VTKTEVTEDQNDSYSLQSD